MKSIILSVLFLLISTPLLHAQQRISGTVTDAASGEALQFANVWVKERSTGTTTDRNGRYTLVLPAGSHTLVVSYIGYQSSTRKVQLPGDVTQNFGLTQSSIEMPTVEFSPDDNPALRIIRRAIEEKEKRAERLQNYSLTSHSKLRVYVKGALEAMARNTGDKLVVSATVDNSEDSTAAEADSSAMPLPILMETQTEAWYAKPDNYKEVIKARKQSAMIPSQGNIMISAFFIVNFYGDEFNFNEGAPIPGPISDWGLDYYSYRLTGETMLDDAKLYMIDFHPLGENDPGLEGSIYIADSSYALTMVDLDVNDAAMPTFFGGIGFKQHFQRFKDDLWMPVDVVVDAGIDIPLVDIQINIEGLSVLQDYHINEQINEDFFDRTRIQVLPEADERDSTYWVEHQKIPETSEDKLAYLKADTVKMQLDSAKYSVGFGDFISGGTTGSDDVQFSFPGILSLYRYNRVEGHALDGTVRLAMPELPLRSLYAGAGYGFDDERLKYRIGGNFTFLHSPELRIGAERHFEREFIDAWNDPAGEMLVTLFNLLDRYDYRDYFYADGWSVSASYDPFLLFPMSLRYGEERYYNAMTVGDWSIFNTDEPYRSNPPINEGSVRSLSGTLRFDNRDLIDNAGKISRFGSLEHMPIFSVGWMQADIQGSTWDILTLGGYMSGSFDMGLYGSTSYRLTANYADNALPTQLLYNLQGSMEWLIWPNRFRTLGFREFGGDRRATLYLQHNLRDWLFRASQIPLLKDSGWALKLFANGGWTKMSDETAALQTVGVHETGPVFWEAGFSIDNIFTFFRLDLAWRLNHFRDGENFYIGIGTALL
ncbi:DUF5686 and carboxypeptidase regulatory-like domain-containing protein [bacterium]|nr:DUF5686 and carboxypeptidase regulatory-like domain-containing protein [bacterium]